MPSFQILARFAGRLAPLWICVLAGCNPSGLYRVDGKVVFPDGSPLTAGTVEFVPVNKDALYAPRGDLNADGTFRASTHQENDGAPPGTYRLLITPPEELEPGRPKPKAFDRRFKSYETSGLEYTVKEGKNEFLTITVEPPTKKDEPAVRSPL
jgi:hypothetical protein